MRDVVLHAEHGVVQLQQRRRHPGTRAAAADPTPALARAAAVLVDGAAVRQQEQLERGDLAEGGSRQVREWAEGTWGKRKTPARSPDLTT